MKKIIGEAHNMRVTVDVERCVILLQRISLTGQIVWTDKIPAYSRLSIQAEGRMVLGNIK